MCDLALLCVCVCGMGGGNESFFRLCRCGTGLLNYSSAMVACTDDDDNSTREEGEIL